MDASTKLDPEAEWAQICAYYDIAVKTLDEKTLTVRVRQVRVRQAFHVLAIIETEYPLLNYVCKFPEGDLPPGGIDSLNLTPDAHGELIEKARELNFPVVLSVLERRMGITTKMGTLIPSIQRAKALQSSLTTAP